MEKVAVPIIAKAERKAHRGDPEDRCATHSTELQFDQLRPIR